MSSSEYPLEKALVELDRETDLVRFLEDLLSEAELREFRNRWRAACLLDSGTSYLEIESETGLSSTTIARVSKCIRGEKGGYRLALKKLKAKRK